MQQRFHRRRNWRPGAGACRSRIGAALSLFGFYLRRNLAETEASRKPPHATGGQPLRESANHPKEILLVFGLTMGGTTAFYTYTTYMPTFLVNTVKLTRDQATQISFITLVIYAACNRCSAPSPT